MEWQIRTIARKSALTEEPFAPGDRVVSFVYKEAASGELGRSDFLEPEAAGFEVPGQLLGRWARVVKDPDGEDAAEKRVDIQSSEDFFFSLFEQEADEATRQETDVLKHLLALMLERKRILKQVGGRAAQGVQRYRHVKRNEEMDVPVVDIAPEMMVKIQDTLGDIIL